MVFKKIPSFFKKNEENSRRIIFALTLCIIAGASVKAQEPNSAKPHIFVTLSHSYGDDGKIEIVQPVQIENLLRLQIANNNLQKGIPGYRIRIFSQSGQQARQRSDQARITFMRNFPGIEAYEEYNTPNFQIFVGDFRTKNDALREKKRIERLFPGAFIVSEIINISK